MWFCKLELTQTCSTVLTSSCTTIGYWKTEKICTPSLLMEDIHPCDSNPLLTSPGGGSEWSNSSFTHGTVQRILNCLKLYFNEILKYIPGSKNHVRPTLLALQNPKVSSIQKSHPFKIYAVCITEKFSTNIAASHPILL